MSIYNNKHVVFEQVGVDSDTVVRNQSTNKDTDNCYNNWDISNIRNAVLPTKALALSNELYATLTNTTIQTAKNGNSSTLVSTSDKTFILAEKEMSGTRVNSRTEEFSALTTLGYWVNHTTDSDRIKYDQSSTARAYWLRSPYSGGPGDVVYVRNNGGFSGTGIAYISQRVSQCFAYQMQLMIVKTSRGYVVKSEKGKNLSKPLPTKEKAEERLRQVERFKHIKKGK